MGSCLHRHCIHSNEEENKKLSTEVFLKRYRQGQGPPLDVTEVFFANFDQKIPLIIEVLALIMFMP